MGMDLNIYLAHSRKELESDNFWELAKEQTEETKWSTVGERWYARKWFGMHDELIWEHFKGDYECGEWIELDRDCLETMITYATHHTDYFEGFKSVPDLCEILYHWDDIKEAGLHVYYECDW